MTTDKFTAFYPSRPFWAVSKIDFNDKSRKHWFDDQMEEEVFSQEGDTYKIKVSRDGRIMIRIESLENSKHEKDGHIDIEETVRIWGEYLDYLNVFYLLLDSATLEIDKLSYFNLHEITHRDAFRVTYKDGQSLGENISSESIASVFQMGRFISMYPSGLSIEYHPQINMRHIISIDVIKHTANAFAEVVASPGLEKTLASFAKSLSEYKVGNYETSIILSWFITEAAISHLWKAHIDGLNTEFNEGHKRINRERRDFLTGRDFTMSIISNLLELWKSISYSQFQDIDTVRGLRNKIVHGYNFVPGPKEAQLSMNTAQTMIERLWKFKFTPNMSYSVAGI